MRNGREELQEEAVCAQEHTHTEISTCCGSTHIYTHTTTCIHCTHTAVLEVEATVGKTGKNEIEMKAFQVI